MNTRSQNRPRRIAAPRLLWFVLPLLFGPVHAQTAYGWTLAFVDDFNGTSLDRTKWNTTYMWSGVGARTLPDNHELQVYWDDQFEVANGILSIRADRRDTVWNGQTYRYASGVITTYQKFAPQYGYIEMRAKLPQGKGLFPAFWTVLNRPLWPPEIDIMEVLGDRSEQVNMTVHGKRSTTDNTHIVPFHAALGSFDTSTGFHVYAAEWDANNITWYLDGRRVFSGPTPWDFHEPMQLIANLAVGGDWPGAPDASTVFPAYMEIDYIRAWRRDSSAEATPHYAGYTVGSVGTPGWNRIPTSGSATINGAGTGFTMGGSADNFHLVGRPLDGDGEVVLQVESMSLAASAQTGLMIRESTAAGARYSAIYLTNGASHFQSRPVAGAAAERDYRTPSVSAPRWLLLRRRGNTVTAFHSSDGRAWTFAGGRSLTLPSRTLIGIAVSGGTPSALNTSTINNLDQLPTATLDATYPAPIGVTITGTSAWSSSAYTFGYSGNDYLHDNGGDKGNKSVRYTPWFPTGGTYAIVMDWTCEPNRARNAPATVTHPAGSTPLLALDQRKNGDGACVGYFRFSAGNTGSLLLENRGTTSGQVVVADSVRFIATAPLSLVLDNAAGSGVAFTGTWTPSSVVAGYNGSGYLHDGGNKTETKTATFTFNPEHAGLYAVALNWLPDADRSPRVPVQITHADGVSTVEVDQRTGGSWIEVPGAYRYAPGVPFSVRISNAGTTGIVIVDAVKLDSVAVAVPQTSL